MADFTVDVAQLESLQTELKNLSRRTNDVAGAVYAISQGIGGIKSLANKGYPTKINAVRGQIRVAADGARTASFRLSDVAHAYRVYDRQVREIIVDTQAGAAAVRSGILKPSNTRKRSFGEIFRAAAKETWDQTVSNYHEFGDLVGDFHVWRATRGSDFVEGIYKRLGEDSALKLLIEGQVDKYNEKLTSLEKMVNAFTHPLDANALGSGASGFADLIGFGWVPGLISKYGDMSDYYTSKGAQQIASGRVLQGLATGLGGPLLTFGTMSVDACFKTAKGVAKDTLPGGLLIGAANSLSKFFTGKEAESHIDHLFGGIGNRISGGFDSLVGA